MLRDAVVIIVEYTSCSLVAPMIRGIQFGVFTRSSAAVGSALSAVPPALSSFLQEARRCTGAVGEATALHPREEEDAVRPLAVDDVHDAPLSTTGALPGPAPAEVVPADATQPDGTDGASPRTTAGLRAEARVGQDEAAGPLHTGVAGP